MTAGSANTSPVGTSLPATLPPAAAAALLPPQTAAMAAYLGAAAVAAQQNRLLLGNHRLGIGRPGSPPLLPMQSPLGGDASILDFSTRRKSQDFDDRGRDTQKISSNDVVNLSKSDNGPLDLSVSRKRNNSSPPPQSVTPSRKMNRPMDYKSAIVSPWTSPIAPYFAAAVAAANLSPKIQTQNEWNGKNKINTPNDATKALEKMSELSRLGGNDVGRQTSGNTGGNSNSGNVSSGGGRHSAWQSHWLNKGADAVKDVFKCVWCNQSFPTLETLAIHVKETQHMGVNMPTESQRQHHQSHQSHHGSSHHAPPTSSSNNTSKADLNLLIKETMPLPRKLVRGQDVWLGKGAEQTRQILKCMWCGQSFRSLSEMTTHMQQTQHYTNIISQEQIISWKSSDDTKSGSSNSGANNGPNSAGAASGTSSTVSAVLTCKVCDQAFTSLKDLSNHMVKNSHYKEHIMRSISESGGRRRQTREKRKKSLPVRKLLELERAQHEYKNGDASSLNKSLRDASSGRITCEKCGEKIDTSVFVEHIRQCVGGIALNTSSQRNILKTALASNSIIPTDSLSPMTPSSRDGRKSIGDECISPRSRHISPNAISDLASPLSKDGSSATGGGDKNNSPSVLNAIEQLIEKSFDTRTRHGSGYGGSNAQSAPLGSSILKRLGIDESVDYTKPLIDTQTMNFLRNYSQQSASSYGRRERSGSESSSVSERNSRVDSVTPDRKVDPSNIATARTTPDKISQNSSMEDNEKPTIKPEPMDDDQPIRVKSHDEQLNVTIKKEDDIEDRTKDIKHEGDGENLPTKLGSSVQSSPAPSPRLSTPVGGQTTPLASPCSDRSATPRSTPGVTEKKSSLTTGGSLGALSSMFDNLTGSGNTTNPSDGQTASGKKGTSNPLAALQKLCDKTENSPPSNRHNSSSTQALAVPAPTSKTNTASGAILAFSWACNDAVMTSDSVIKCAYCDTPFCSKGAYRHHLSKAHFIPDDGLDPMVTKAQLKPTTHTRQHTPPTQVHSPKSAASSTSSSGNGVTNRMVKSPTPPAVPAAPSSADSATGTSGANCHRNQPSGSAFEESPHSKFLKYTELAKQLSSKYV